MFRSNKIKHIKYFFSFALILAFGWKATSRHVIGRRSDFIVLPPDSGKQNTPPNIKMPYPIKDRKPYETNPSKNPFDLADPANIKNKYQLDPNSNNYNYSSKVGKLDYRMPGSTSIKSQLQKDNKRLTKDYFKQRAQANNFVKGNSLIPPIVANNKIFDKIFGSGVIDIRPRGTAELIFQGNFNDVKNPALSPRMQSTGQFDFRQKIQLNVAGSVGDKLKVNMNYDTEATFEFENQMKLDYAGKEDDIIKKIELGNVSLPLNSSLIQGSQSLFGVKSTMQFGKMTVTTVFSQQRGKTTETEIAGGAQTTKFDIQAHDYDMNRHYFLSQYFRDNYERALANLPIINSQVIITRIEVWVTNRSGVFEQSRDVIGFADLGESDKTINQNWVKNPSVKLGNAANGLIGYLYGHGNSLNTDTSGTKSVKTALRRSFEIQNQLLKDENQTKLAPISEYQIVNYSRQLNATEFTWNRNLGYISLNQALTNDDVLNVSYEGTIGGIPFKVGEFSQDLPTDPINPNVLHLKMLKGPSMRPDLVTWGLMMKNIYSLGSYNIASKDFKLNVIYADDPSGADLNYLPVKNEPLLTGKPLLTALNLDNMNTMQERAPDGLYDWIEGVSVQSSTGRIIFPVLEPFGTHLEKKFVTDATKARYYCFFELYDSTKFSAIQLPQYDKFFIRGSYTGAANNEIPLNSTNVPRGSVRVTANGAPLTENVDFIVDYNLGRVKIVNTQLLSSGAVIRVSSESNNLFQVQQKTLMGARFDYKENKDLLLGGTLMYLTERPLTPKVNIGEEPISNLVVGLDGTYKRDSRFLTKMVDRLPFIETKEPSNITLSGEYAQLIPGIQSSLAQSGTAYLDDFEASETPFDLRMGSYWALASTPQGQPDLFPEGDLYNSYQYNFRRANLSWYTIASTFYRNDTYTPEHIKGDPNAISNHRMREVLQTEIFRKKQIQQGLPATLPTFDLTFYPSERGPYNFNVKDLNFDGSLKNPKSNWGGIMRKIDQNDFEQANIDYIEIWVQDPFADNPSSSDKGYLYLNLGNISEDILHDNRRSAENGLPNSNDPVQQSIADSTTWGRVPRQAVPSYVFSSDAAERAKQDVGLDGIDDNLEKKWFADNYLKQIENAPGLGINSEAYKKASTDPSNDNYSYYLSADYDANAKDIISRYRRFNMTQGNSPTVDPNAAYPSAATNVPDNEDLNKDYTVNTVEEYFQYKIEISKQALQIGKNFVTDTIYTNASFANGNQAPEVWYQLKVPVYEYQQKIGNISDFKSIRFARMFMRGFEDSITLRFANLQLVRADWRKYQNSLKQGGEDQPIDPTDNTQFVVSTVNIEKNPYYSVPPGIQREADFSSPQTIYQNEQALSVKVCNLADGDSRAVFKNLTTDLRQYGKLRMFTHAEGTNLKDDELTAFIRIGTDAINNYYEYEIPLKVPKYGSGLPSARDVWPLANEISISMDELINTKIARTNANWPFTRPYIRQDGSVKYTVVGLPDFSQVRVVMMGVRNPKRVAGSDDDGLPKCAEVWFNELRMTDFNTRGGWAANGRVIAKLADFGNVQLTGSIATVGWGGIDKKLSERSFNDNYQYDFASNFELGKFFPKTSGISIPFFFSYGNTIIRPYYNPLNPDTKLQKEIDESTNPERKTQITKAADDFTSRRSFNFTNVRKNRVAMKKAYPWDIENLNFSYSFAETFRRNQTIEYSILQTYKGQVGYTYTFPNSTIEPFNKIKSKSLTLIKDINFSLLPSSWGARVEAERRYGELINRNNDNQNTIIQALYDKNFTMRRFYELRWDFTKNLKFNYTATADARIDEPIGKIESNTARADSIQTNFWNGGRLTRYDQSAGINYSLPLNKLPYLDFISQSSYNYTTNFQWLQAPPAADSLGSTIQNSRQQQFNLAFNMPTLYNKFKFLRDINTPATPKDPSKTKKTEIEKSPKNEKDKTTKKKKEDNGPVNYPFWVKIPVKLITSLKNLQGSYSITDGTTLPGFKVKPQYLGQNFDNGGPGFDFIFGYQNDDYRFKAAQNGWLSGDPRVVNPYLQNHQERLDGRATLDPFDDFRVTINVGKTTSLSTTSYFRFDPDSNVYRDFGPVQEQGTYSITYNAFLTSFSSEGSDGISEVFKTFSENRKVIADRLGNVKGINQRDTANFPIGYGPYSQDVLIPAFLAAYSGADAKNIELTAFPKIPLPNWNISYSGLSKIPLIKEYASNVNITHAYTSQYTVGGFQTQIDTSRQLNVSSDYQPYYIIRNIAITERWGPLIGIDVTLANNLTTGIKYNKDRSLNFALGNRQLSELNADEIVYSLGYRTKKLTLPFKIQGRRRVLENDINFRVDFSIRDNVTKIRNLDVPTNVPVTGQMVYSFKPTIDYMINEKLTLSIFYDRRQTNPYTSGSFPTIITSGGFKLRYTIQ